MSTCIRRKALLEGTETWWGQLRWWVHTRRCPECAERVRTEQEMTALLQGLGAWEEPFGLAERVLVRRVMTLPVVAALPKSHAAARIRRRKRGTSWAAVGTVCALALWFVFRPDFHRDVAFADMMDALNRQAVFHTYGSIVRRSPQNKMREEQFDLRVERSSEYTDGSMMEWKVFWVLRPSPKHAAQRIEDVFPLHAKVDFPNFLFLYTRHDPLSEKIVQAELLSPELLFGGKVGFQYVLTPLPLLSREVAESLLHHPLATIAERPRKVAGRREKVMVLTLHDKVRQRVQWRFHVAEGMRLPYRVEVIYRQGEEIAMQADYAVDYSSVH
jgi:hypothetical protein